MHTLKVFVVDDSSIVRDRLVAMVSALPGITTVGQAQDASEAIEGIHWTQPDVVILDIHMPGRNGIDVLYQLKEMQPAPKVIMLTNYAYQQYRKKCEQAGADFFFDKSTEFDQIPQALEQVNRGLQAEPGAGSCNSAD
jgi:DNA-binding NarL/FixJ family response regulator